MTMGLCIETKSFAPNNFWNKKKKVQVMFKKAERENENVQFRASVHSPNNYKSWDLVRLREI